MKWDSQSAQNQIDLVEHALRQVTKIPPSGWNAIPTDLQPSFAKYMHKDAWTGEPDPLTLADSALMIVRDAITRTGEFADGSREIPERRQTHGAGPG
jgi:hypothetical protein